MAINRFFRRTAAAFEPELLPVEAVAAAAQNRQKQFDVNFQMAEKIGETSINALTQDRGRANTIVQGYKSEVSDIVNKSGGDFSRLGQQLRSLSSKIKRDFLPGGEVHAIQLNKSLEDQFIKENKERVKKGDITADQLDGGLAFLRRNFEGTNFDPNSREGQILNTFSINKFTDINKKSLDIAEKIIPQIQEEGFDYVNGSWVKTFNGKTEILTQEDIAQTVLGNLMNDQEVIQFLVQQGQFSNNTPPTNADILATLTPFALSAGEVFQKNNVSVKESQKANPFSLESIRQAGQQPVIGFVRDTVTVKPKSRTGTLSLSTLVGKDPDHRLTGRQGPIGAFNKTDLSTNTAKFEDFKQMLDSKEGLARFEREGIDPNLLKVILKDNPNASNEDIINMYERSNQFANNAAQSIFHDLGRKPMEELTKTIIDSNAYLNMSTRFITPEGQLSSDMSAKEAIGKMGLTKDELKNLTISGIENAGEGRSNLGLRVVTPKGTLIIQDALPVQATDAYAPAFELGRINFTEDLESTHVNINQGIPGMDPMWVKSVKEFEFNPYANVYETRIKLYQTDSQGLRLPDENGEISPMTDESGRFEVTPNDISQRLTDAGVLQQVMPRGASSSNNRRFNTN